MSTEHATTTSCRCSCRTGRACSPACRRPVRPPRLQHLLARGRARRGRALQPHHDRRRRRVVAARADHQAAVQADRGRQDQRARPAALGRARAAARHGAGRRPSSAARSSSSSTIFEGKILAVGLEAITVSLEGHPDKLDDFEELLAGYGIVELQRTGRVALPKLDREQRAPRVPLKGKG